MQSIKQIIATTMIVLIYIVTFSGSGEANLNDTSFDNNGFMVQDFGLGNDEIYGVTIQPDGQILVVGYASNGVNKNLAVARYLPSGALDTNFNNDGYATFSLGSGDFTGTSIALQNDGKPVIAGHSQDGDEQTIVVIRLTNDGFEDKNFAGDGQLLIPIENGTIINNVLKLTNQDQLIVANTVKLDDGGANTTLCRVTTQGELDNTFGDNGISIIAEDLGGTLNSFISLDDGKILAGGAKEKQATLLRLNSDGSIDDSFGEEGIIILPLDGEQSVSNDLLINQQREVLILGTSWQDNSPTSFIAKTDQSGILVTEFGLSGIYTTDIPDENIGKAITVTDNDEIIVAGYTKTATGNDIFTLRLSAQIQSSQNSNELEAEAAATYTIASNSTGDVGYGVAVQNDGTIIVAGSTENGSDKDFALVLIAETKQSTITKAASLGVTTSGFTLTTDAVSDITRISALSGGTITQTEVISCTDICTTQCGSSTGTCYEDCLSTCVSSPTVTLRGICFALSTGPTYQDGDDSEETETTVNLNLGVFPEDQPSLTGVVASGHTEDGSGTGSYTSEIEEVTPNSKYYLRAYALLSDDSVIYGNEVVFQSNDACFIATAAYGSIFAEPVVVLRELRDRILMKNGAGQRLVSFYYRYSPPIAKFVANNAAAKFVVQLWLLPIISLSFIVLHITFVIKAFILCGFLSLTLIVVRKKIFTGGNQ